MYVTCGMICKDIVLAGGPWADLDELAQLHADVCGQDLGGDADGLPPVNWNAQLQCLCSALPP